MGMRFLPIIQSFLIQIRFILNGCSQETKCFRLSTTMTTFGLKLKTSYFLGHILAWAWHIAHLAQRSTNGVFRPTNISKIITQAKINCSPLTPLPEVFRLGFVRKRPFLLARTVVSKDLQIINILTLCSNVNTISPVAVPHDDIKLIFQKDYTSP